MRRECFCGCGRKLAFLNRRISKLGERHDRALEAMREIVIPELELRAETNLSSVHDYAVSIATVEDFIRDGETLRWRLVAIAHGLPVEPGDHGDIHTWQHTAAKTARKAAKDYRRYRGERERAGENVEALVVCLGFSWRLH